MRIRSTILAAGVLLALTAGSSAAAATSQVTDEDSTTIDGVEVATDLEIDTSKELAELLESDEPKTVTIDVNTGKVTTVDAGTTVSVTWGRWRIQ